MNGCGHIRCVQGDVGNLQMDDAAFDVIVSMNGFHAFPNKEAAQIAVETVVEFLQNSQKIERVIFDVFKDEDFKIYQKILELKEIKSHLTSKEKK